MEASDRAFLAELKTCVLAAVEKDEPVGGMRDDEPWFGDESRLELDSLDALQISMAIQKKYGVRMPDSKETRRALVSLLALAEHLRVRMSA
ncbi:MAG: acyl carrier protein [Gammaproteobacteria bacterium]|nr:acyl carrier protein [Gammaproteobacteria bacterium]MBU1415866.1 acyl carrier protein [Gammaproteobacteria bacterium]